MYFKAQNDAKITLHAKTAYALVPMRVTRLDKMIDSILYVNLARVPFYGLSNGGNLCLPFFVFSFSNYIILL